MSERKGLPTGPTDLKVLRTLFAKRPDKEQRCISLNLVGAYQVGAVKSKWTDRVDKERILCGEVDTRSQRLLECQATKEIRQTHAQGVQALRDRPGWLYMPIPTQTDQHVAWRHLMNTQPELENVEPVTCESALHFFTDGSVNAPRDPNTRVAVFGIVQAIGMHGREANREGHLPDFRCLQVAHVQGSQTISRAELSAVLVVAASTTALERGKLVWIYTDSQYVVGTVKRIEMGEVDARAHKMANWDLVGRLRAVWRKETHRIVKVKAHRALEEAEGDEDMYRILGNTKADEAANALHLVQSQTIADHRKSIQEHDPRQIEALQHLFDYLVDHNKCRAALVEQKDKEQKGAINAELTADQRLQEMYDNLKAETKCRYQTVQLRELDPHVAQGVIQGPFEAMAVHKWLQTLEWPVDGIGDYPEIGISWVELYINFHVTTGHRLPVSLTRASAGPQDYRPHVSKEILVHPPKLRSLTVMANTLQSIVNTLNTLTGCNSLQHVKKFWSGSLAKLGITSKYVTASGVTPRPKIAMCCETMDALRDYTQSYAEEVSLNHELPVSKVRPCIETHSESIPVKLTPIECKRRNQAIRCQIRRACT